MENEKTRARIAALTQEMEAIHLANESYWRRGEAAILDERAAYCGRLERLDQIRAELAQIGSS
jgi:hypothetical protein